MRFSEAPKSETIQFRVTREERDYLTAKAARLGTTLAGVLRMAIDAWLQDQPAASSGGPSGKRDSASSATPSRPSTNVKAPSKRRPSNSKGMTQ